ncbi:N-acetylmuramoyl-L-alanine amidase [uncultured Clostridium sp.]|uniref:N-acetylmuramoyl-L-alanine amidase family protein n=1 Tax=uncultured Clostridium sp. TaxID=59620 RepID=UPI0025E0F78D|nr:N-acetylmuramoyl-L-alanine amidase [uncultured Clostridium sp.]
MSKFIIKAVSILMIIGLVAGCGSQPQSNTGSDAETTVSSQEESNKSEEADIESENNKTEEEKSSQAAADTDDKAEENKEAAKEVNNQAASTKNNDNSKKVIVIDPGHASRSNLEKEEQSPNSGIMKIKDGGGAQGNTTGTPEYVVNMSVAMKLKALLEADNYTVIMTKTSNAESLGNIERANIGNDNNASLVIRIHCDSAENASANGASMLVPAKVGYASAVSDISRKYGETVLNSLVESAGMKNRGISVRDDMTGFNWSKVPVILVEMGFMSNPNEDVSLSDPAYQDKLAQGLRNGIERCFQ